MQALLEDLHAGEEEISFRAHNVETPTPEGFMAIPNGEAISIIEAVALAQRETSSRDEAAKYQTLRIVDVATQSVLGVYANGVLIGGASSAALHSIISMQLPPRPEPIPRSILLYGM